MKILKFMAVSYLVKTLLIGIAWLFIPDLPQRATALFHRVWTGVEAPAKSTDPVPALAVPASPVSAPGKNYTGPR
jgi:hypothetical protein